MVSKAIVFSILLTLGASNMALSEDAPKVGRQFAMQTTLSFSEGKGKPPTEFTMRYWLYLPKEYDVKKEHFPLLLFMHGAGERGDDLDRVAIHGPPSLAAAGKHFPFIIVSPLHEKTGPWRENPWPVARVAVLLDYLEKKFRIDKDREYVTGLSMGGFGTWSFITMQPNRFAAAAPICGGGDVTQSVKLKHLPIWAFHGDQDKAVPLAESQRMVDAINQAGGKAKLTVYEGVGHGSWKPAYKDEKLYKWFLSHKRKTDSP